ncbi:MAG: hypothetical protein QM734_12660 [Cyclobacteriaceae bacterium]
MHCLSDAPASAYADLGKGMPPMITNPLDRNYGRPAIVPAVNTISKNFRFPSSLENKSCSG